MMDVVDFIEKQYQRLESLAVLFRDICTSRRWVFDYHWFEDSFSEACVYICKKKEFQSQRHLENYFWQALQSKYITRMKGYFIQKKRISYFSNGSLEFDSLVTPFDYFGLDAQMVSDVSLYCLSHPSASEFYLSSMYLSPKTDKYLTMDHRDIEDAVKEALKNSPALFYFERFKTQYEAREIRKNAAKSYSGFLKSNLDASPLAPFSEIEHENTNIVEFRRSFLQIHCSVSFKIDLSHGDDTVKVSVNVTENARKVAP